MIPIFDTSKFGYFDLTATQALPAPPPLLKFGPPPKIVQKRFLDDLEQKKKFWYKMTQKT